MQYASETFFLYGPPATGKSTCARNLAAALGKRAVDLDALIEALKEILAKGSES